MSDKYQIALPEPISAQLKELADAAGEPPSTLAAQLIRQCIAQAAPAGQVGAPQPVLADDKSGDRPRWLEPYGGDPGWRSQMWGQIVALHGRYPTILSHLKDRWWTDEHHTEMICALATWRGEIDDAGIDPREEIAFHNQLLRYAQTLRREGGGVTKAWKPGAPPVEWAEEQRA